MQDVALDACCLINLCAAGAVLRPPASSPAKARHGAKAPARATSHSGFGLSLHVPTKVTAEALYIKQPDEEDNTKLVKFPVDLQEYVAAGLLTPCDFQDQAEVELFVQMASQLGDGEAACFAIAAKRGWALATDDRRATKLAADSSLAVITTPELVKLWAENTNARDEEIVTVLENIQKFASFTPRASAPEYAWWVGCLGKGRK